MIEQVHAETYSLLIETYVRDQEEKRFLFNGMDNSEYCGLCSAGRAGMLTPGSPRHSEKGRVGDEVYH